MGLGGTEATVTAALIGPLFQPWVIDDDCGAVGRINEWQGKPKYSEKTCQTAALSTTDPTLLHAGSNPDRRVGKPATNRYN
jgi:hypothetical protein